MGSGGGPDSGHDSGPGRTAGRDAGDARAPISFAAIALVVVSAAIFVLLLTTAAVAFLPVGAKPWAAFMGIGLTIAAMALASRYMTAKALARDDERAARRRGEPGGTAERPEGRA